jgi:selenide, water dikinase
MLATLSQPFGLSELLVGHDTADDAAALQLDGERVLVQTVDFFTPIVDDPETFGAIAAANSISDIYAMGATPILGLALAMFPSDVLPLSVLEGILRGGIRKASEAGFPIGGGHTIIDDIPKYGLAVTGLVSPENLVRNSTARAGDTLFLTKPIGSGILVAAHRAHGASLFRRFRSSAPSLEEAIDWMLMLNRDASKLMVETGVNAATDVTGYGLVGHLLEICLASGTGARIDTGAVPVLSGVRDLLSRGHSPEGTRRNARSFRASVELEAGELEYLLMCDAQTSGGLLISVSEEKRPGLVAKFERDGLLLAKIGEMTDRAGVVRLV